MSLGARRQAKTASWNVYNVLHKMQHVHTSIALLCLGRLQRAFRWIGRLVGENASLFLLISILISTVSYGAFNLRVAQRLQDGFISRQSKARVEDSIKAQFEGEENRNLQRFVALIRRTDRENLLDKEIFQDINKVYSFIKNNISVKVDKTRYVHSEICGNHCEVNQLLWAFQKCVEGVYANEDVFVDHPQSRYQSYTFLMAPHVFGIERKVVGQSVEREMEERDNSSVFIPYNSQVTWPVSSNRTAIASASLIAVYFQAPIPDDYSTNIVTEWEEAVFRWSQDPHRPFGHLRIDVMGDKVLGREMTRGGLSLLPHLIAGITLTVLFVTIAVLWSAHSAGGWHVGLLFVILGIIMSPLLAVSSTFGIMGFLGIEAYPMHMVIPFLILAIGVDDAFLMTHAWNRLRPKVAPFGNKNTADLLAQVLEEVGPSITITSLTNAMAFAIGVAVAVPAMQMFCITAAVAICLDFLFEITLFGSMLVISARFQPNVAEEEKKKQESFGFRYGRELTRPQTRLLIGLLTVAYVAASIFGTVQMETKVDSQKIIPENSTLRISDQLFKDFYWKEYEAIYIYVNNPPSRLDTSSLAELKKMVEEFESMTRAIGSKSTMLWLNDYEKGTRGIYQLYNFIGGGGYSLDYEELPQFVREPLVGSFWNRTMKWHRDEKTKHVIMDQFFFVTGIHNASTWVERAENMLEWREIADRWQKFNVTVYSENSGVFEGIFSLGGQTILAASLTLISMTGVCLLFVPSFIGVICAGLAIASISIGVLGFLSLFGMDLDPVTMSAIVMSIGFSVDYTAHVSYHFQHSLSILPNYATSAECVQYTVEAVAWPMAEAAVSTLVCFLPVAFHPDYTPTVFTKTIFFVVLFGIIHGLVILPTILAMIPRKFFFFTPDEEEIISSVPAAARPLLLPSQPGVQVIKPPLLLPPLEASSSTLSGETTLSLLVSSGL